MIVKEGGPTGPPLGLKRIKYTLGPLGLKMDKMNLSYFLPVEALNQKMAEVIKKIFGFVHNFIEFHLPHNVIL